MIHHDGMWAKRLPREFAGDGLFDDLSFLRS